MQAAPTVLTQQLHKDSKQELWQIGSSGKFWLAHGVQVVNWELIFLRIIY